MDYRHVAGWAADAASRALVEAECRRQGVRFTVDGPAFEFHANLEKTKAIEAVIAADGRLHRFHGVPVAGGTHGGMGVADGIGAQAWRVAVGTIDDWQARYAALRQAIQVALDRH